jgi:succinate-acetate transporter protein
MHAARGRRRAPTPSALSAEAPLRLHAATHAIAVLTLVVATATRSQGLAAIAGLAGLVAALAFAAFFATLARRTAAAARAGDESPRP